MLIKYYDITVLPKTRKRKNVQDMNVCARIAILLFISLIILASEISLSFASYSSTKTVATSGTIVYNTYIVTTLTELTNVVSKVVPGDIVLIRGGIYQPTSRLEFQASGTSSNPITFAAYPGETVIIDGSLYNPPSGSFWALVMLNGNWITLRNIQVRNAQAGQSIGNGGIYVYGDDCVLDHCEMYNNAGMGGCTYGARTQFRYCVSHDNVDNGPNQANGGNADGLGAQSGSSGAYFFGCITYRNSDDGLDNLQGSGATVENCVSYGNGLLQGDGAGFKVGINQITRKCIAYNNNLEGFTSPVSDASADGYDTFDHCTAYNNGIATSGPLGKAASGRLDFDAMGTGCVFTNNIGASAGLWGSQVTSNHNTWDLSITDYGFASTDPTSANFLSLLVNSPCRSTASDGSDIGALQYGESISDLLGI